MEEIRTAMKKANKMNRARYQISFRNPKRSSTSTVKSAALILRALAWVELDSVIPRYISRQTCFLLDLNLQRNSDFLVFTGTTDH